MYFIFRHERNPRESDGTEALEEYFNAGDYTPEEIENELKTLNISNIYFFQEDTTK